MASPQGSETGPSWVCRGMVPAITVGLAPPDSEGLSSTWMASSVIATHRYLIMNIVRPVAQLTRKYPKFGAAWQMKACRMRLPGGGAASCSRSDRPPSPLCVPLSPECPVTTSTGSKPPTMTSTEEPASPAPRGMSVLADLGRVLGNLCVTHVGAAGAGSDLSTQWRGEDLSGVVFGEAAVAGVDQEPHVGVVCRGGRRCLRYVRRLVVLAAGTDGSGPQRPAVGVGGDVALMVSCFLL